jgi:predicted RNase H-like nuclease (RuvC/YqgF family)
MRQITLRIEEDTVQSLESEAEEHDTTRSEHIRSIIESRHEPDENTRKLLREKAELEVSIQELEEEIKELEAENDELRDEMDTLEADHQREVDRLTDEMDELEVDLQSEIDRLKNEKAAIINQREENKELVRYVENERTAEQRWREAGLLTRAKWKVFGMDTDEE